jgi:hypothetical protein
MTDAWHHVENFPLYWASEHWSAICKLMNLSFAGWTMDNAAPPSMVMLEIQLPLKLFKESMGRQNM